MEIPKGIVYKPCSDSINIFAKAILTKELNNPSYTIYDQLLYCGPNFWAKYKNDSLIGKITKGNIDFHVPMPNGNTSIKKGKLIQDYNDFRIVWNQICKDFSSPETKIRKPNSSELAQYWSIIFFDIEEPVFIIENKGINLIIDLDQNSKIYFIEIIV